MTALSILSSLAVCLCFYDRILEMNMTIEIETCGNQKQINIIVSNETLITLFKLAIFTIALEMTLQTMYFISKINQTPTHEQNLSEIAENKKMISISNYDRIFCFGCLSWYIFSIKNGFISRSTFQMCQIYYDIANAVTMLCLQQAIYMLQNTQTLSFYLTILIGQV